MSSAITTNVRLLDTLNDPQFQSLDRVVDDGDEMWSSAEHYTNVGLSALEVIDRGLRCCGKDPESVRSILDIPCGHGRVARFLRLRFPKAHLTVSDINIAGVRFCRARFADDSMISDRQLGRLAFGRRFDLIWVGSLITHLDETHTRKLLKVLGRHLQSDGIMLVTSHGSFSAEQMRNGNYFGDAELRVRTLDEYDQNGYGYADYPGQKGYGNSLISKRWFKDNCASINLNLREIFQRAWDNHHDVVVFERRRWWQSVLRVGR